MRRFALSFLVLSQLSGQFAATTGEISLLGIRVSFLEDSDGSTTGDGSFLTQVVTGECGDHTIDPPPHNRSYFEAQLEAVDNYFRAVSNGKFGIDPLKSRIAPEDEHSSYVLDSGMAYFHPYPEETLQDKRLAEFFRASLEKAFEVDGTSFSEFDVIAIFHAGIGQDFVLPFLDPTPEDIPSAYVDSNLLLEQLGVAALSFPDGSTVSSGIILPETQNHLLYDVAEEIFTGVSDPCDYQFGLVGTFALMLGFAIGLPPLWDTDSGESGVGVFALMDQGSNNGRGIIPSPPDAWTRIYAGWESATEVRPTRGVELVARDSLPDQIARVDITGSEYFLIENGNNWVVNGVYIDSIRWRNRRTDGDEIIMPSYVEILMDSTGVGMDSATGVITTVPNYDIGLPGSGLLIWHIDDNKIVEGLHDYMVNTDREHRGVDLEEADGAQDIGYPSIFLFTDPSSGFWSDMWFDGNSEYYRANPGFDGHPPSFGPDTHPDTRSNSGSYSYIEINNISRAGKVMSFAVENSLVADGFPDTSLAMHFFFDFTGDGVAEAIGGRDSLWWSPADSIERHRFLKLPADSFYVVVTNLLQTDPRLAVVSWTADSIRVSTFHFDAESGGFKWDWSRAASASRIPHGLPLFFRGSPDSIAVDLSWGPIGYLVTQDGFSFYQKTEDTSNPSMVVHAHLEDFSMDESHSLRGEIATDDRLVVTVDGAEISGLNGHGFTTISGVDADLDGRIELLLVDDEGSVYSVNENLTGESGFPVHLNATSPVLARDLFGDEHPELVVQVEQGDLVVLDWQGKEQYRLANPPGSKLRVLTQYRGRNSIVTESSIWQFDSVSVTNGNEWPHQHHDPANSRRLTASIPFRSVNEMKLIDNQRTYNYPNPAKGGSTTIRVFVESAEKIEITIYDLAGFYVDMVAMDSPIPGEVNEIVWDVSAVESGVYFANVTATKGDRMENKILKIAVVH